MTSRVLQPASEISTHFRCDNCGVLLDKVTWMQCSICKAFDLCDECADIEYGELPRGTLRDHQDLHTKVTKNAPVTNDCMKSVYIGDAETYRCQARNQRRQEEFDTILNTKKIQNDYDMAVVLDKLKEMTPSPSTNDDKTSQLGSIIVDYFSRANRRNIHILSLDGGGLIKNIVHSFLYIIL
jgi:hypothetical protein